MLLAIVCRVSCKGGQDAFTRLHRASCTAYPDYCDEINGLADGAGVPRQLTMVLSLKHELTFLARGNRSLECTDVLIHSKDTAVVAHNEDGNALVESTGYFVNATFKGKGRGRTLGTNFVAFQYPASVLGHAFGYNEHGVVTSMNAVFPSEVNVNGVGCYFLSRSILDSQSTQNAVERARAPVRAYGTSNNVGSAASHDVVNIETSPDAIAVSSPSPLAFHMNEYLHAKTAQHKDPSSEHRLHRAEELAQNGGMADVQGALKVLSDTNDEQYPLYRTTTPPDDCSTLATAAFDLHRCTLRVYTAPAATSAPVLEFSLPSCNTTSHAKRATS